MTETDRALSSLGNEPDNGCTIDIGAAFGPLSVVHAALDAVGHGRPCGTVAYFPGHSIEELHAAVAAAQSRFPILRRRLQWRDGRPVLTSSDTSIIASAQQDARRILTFSASAAHGRLWQHGFCADAGGVWFFAGWAHAAADGMSMLRFLSAVSAALAGREVPFLPRLSRAAVRCSPFPAWFCGFALSHLRRYISAAPASGAAPGATWLVVPADLADRALRETAEAGTGVAARLAAATAIAVCRRLGHGPAGNVHLNIPIWREEPAGGFGFGVGSLLLGVRVRRGDCVITLAPRIGRQMRQAIESGWDLNLQRFLGSNPRRHRRFARLQASPSVSRSISVSWKGRIEGLGGARHVACFGTTPTLHVSGHVDANGLSLSLTSAHSPSLREALLLDIAEHFGVGRSHRLFELENLPCG